MVTRAANPDPQTDRSPRREQPWKARATEADDRSRQGPQTDEP